MDTRTFIVEILSAVIWPIIILAIFLIFRRQIVDSFKFLKTVKLKDVQIEFVERLDIVEKKSRQIVGDGDTDSSLKETIEELDRLADKSPESAIIFAWRSVEDALTEKGRQSSIDLKPKIYDMPLILSYYLHDAGLLSESQDDLIQELKILKDQVARGTVQVTIPDAVRYSSLASRIIRSLKSEGK